MLKQFLFIAVLVLTTCCVASAQEPAAKLNFKAPSGWVEEKASSAMRVAQYKLPKETGDGEDASLVVYYFGKGQGGGTAANIERWVNQMKQPEGSTSKPKAKEGSLTVNGLKVTTIDVAGTYTAETSPGSGQFYNNPNYRLQAAVIETPRGSYYLKVVGPEKTIAKWDNSVTEFVKSFEFK